MKNSSINFKEIGINALMGLGLYFMIKKFTQVKTETVPLPNIGNTIDPVTTQYQSKYFTDKEYFGNYQKPDKYYANWKLLSMVLDKIRTAYGSAVIITSGYMPTYDGVIRESYNMCTGVIIYPQNNDYNYLFSVVKSLAGINTISVKKFNQTDSKQVYIEI